MSNCEEKCITKTDYSEEMSNYDIWFFFNC